MSQVQISPPSYVASPNPALWFSSNAGDALIWKDTGATAMMSAHLAAVCEPLAKQLGGLPSLTAILFIVDALNKPWSADIAASRIAGIGHPLKHPDHWATQSKRHLVFAEWLQSLSRIPAELRSGVAAQRAILCDLFDGLPERNLELEAAQASDAIAWLGLASVDHEQNYNWGKEVSIEKCALAIVAIAHASKRPMDEASVRFRQRIGLDSLPTYPSAIEPLPEMQSYADLLMEWSNDEELGQLAAMAMSTAATITLPRRPSDPDSLPSGGVSDIVNRGHPERLLATELAADPDLLTARIANGQALYLRRESPPKQQPLRRQVLIENGIRTWGITRVRATAFALAVAASEERRGGTKPQVYTVAGANVWAENIATRDGLLQQLERIEVDPHPGKAVQTLLATQSTKNNNNLDRFAEPLLIVTANTDRDGDFRRAIDSLPRPYLVARIDREGLVELIKRTAAGDEILHRQRMVLPEKNLGIKLSRSRDLPMLLSLPTCPLRFSADLTSKSSHVSPGPTLWLTTINRRLLCFDKANVGAIDVMSLPTSKILASESRGHDAIAFVIEEQTGVGQAVRHLLIEVNKTGEKKVHILGTTGDRGGQVTYAFDKGLLVRIGLSVTFFSIETGRELGRAIVKGRHVGGVFFNQSPSALSPVWMATYSAGSVEFKQLGDCSMAVGIAARGRGGLPVVYSDDLSKMQIFHGDHSHVRDTGVRVSSPSGPRFIACDLHSTTMLVAVSNVLDTSGFKTIYQQTAANGLFRLNLSAPGVEAISDEQVGRRALDPIAYTMVTTQSIRNRLSAIGSDGECLLLSRNRSIHYEISERNSPQRLALTPRKHLGESTVMCDFDNFTNADGQRFKHHWNLQRATLGACIAWLDSRGLLHLRKPDGSEMSLVLHDSNLAGWHNQYSLFGTKYFTGEPSDTPVPAVVATWLKDFAKQCIK